jgi:hypothetical protein
LDAELEQEDELKRIEENCDSRERRQNLENANLAVFRRCGVGLGFIMWGWRKVGAVSV